MWGLLGSCGGYARGAFGLVQFGDAVQRWGADSPRGIGLAFPLGVVALNASEMRRAPCPRATGGEP